MAAFWMLAAPGALAQLTTEQRLFDFELLASLYARRYGPAAWKQQSIGVDIYALKPWAEQVRAAKSDIEYFEIVSKYVASFRDGHSGFVTPSRFRADLGIFVDIFDGKVLIEQISRGRYPQDAFPFEIGDELISIDGRPVEELMAELAAQQSYSNPRTTRRAAADAMTFRLQSEYPRAAELPDESRVAIRRASGNLEVYTLTWVKTGTPLTLVAPVDSPVLGRAGIDKWAGFDGEATLRELKNWSAPAERVAGRRRVMDGEAGEERSYVTGWGSRTPYYTPPAGFQMRVGRQPTDAFYSGTYEANGNRIGLLRIGSFLAPISNSFAVSQLDAEIAYLRANTDGLVVDVTRNTGGGCLGLDVATRLIPNKFWFFGEQLRPTTALVNQYETLVSAARAASAEQWVIDTYAAVLEALRAAQKTKRATTEPIPACSTTGSSLLSRPPSFEHDPAQSPGGEVTAYEKPIIFLVDEFSVSFGDIFPAMMQDNERGPIVGMRTGGFGGSVSSFAVGFYMEASATNTNSLVVRKRDVVSPDMPTAPYIENIGVIPDIELDYMTRENLMTRGGPFVEAFTRIISEEITKRK
jgi:hypothetical protein